MCKQDKRSIRMKQLAVVIGQSSLSYSPLGVLLISEMFNFLQVKCRRGGECTVGCNVILVSDEDRDNVNATITTNIIRSRLLERGCILNVVVDNTYTASELTMLCVFF